MSAAGRKDTKMPGPIPNGVLVELLDPEDRSKVIGEGTVRDYDAKYQPAPVYRILLANGLPCDWAAALVQRKVPAPPDWAALEAEMVRCSHEATRTVTGYQYAALAAAVAYVHVPPWRFCDTCAHRACVLTRALMDVGKARLGWEV